MDQSGQLTVAHRLRIMLLNILIHNIKPFQLDPALQAVLLRKNFLSIMPYQIGQQLKQIPLAHQPATDLLPQILLVNAEHYTTDLFIPMNQRLKNNIFVCQLLGKILHGKNDHQRFQLCAFTYSLMENIAVGNHQITLHGSYLILVQAENPPPGYHIMQFNMLVPMSVKIISLSVGSVDKQLDRELLILENFFFIELQHLCHSSSPPLPANSEPVAADTTDQITFYRIFSPMYTFARS